MIERESRIKVLIIEDNPYDAKIITELFKDIPGDTFTLAFAETLEKAAAAGGADVVLLDLNLPDSYGPQTLSRAEEMFPDAPIIVMTGFYEEHLGVDLIKKGAQDYLVKGKITGDWLAYSIKYSIERARIERKIMQREGHLRDILEKSPDGFVVTRRDGRVLFANHGAELIFGRTREDLMRHPFPLEADTERMTETELHRLDGKKVPLEIRAVEIHWDAETCRLVILRDLSPVRTLERHRNEFISMVSHELRSPLTVVKESLDLVSDGTAGAVNERQKDILRIGMENTTRLQRLIDALLDITKIEAGVMQLEMSRTDLGALVAAVAGDYAYVAAEKRVSLVKNVPDAPLAAYCDADKLRQVLVNLVSNALKFTPENGTISLSLRPWEGEALFCVEDSGPGIDPEDAPRLFNKFSQLGTQSPGIKGTGLGLAISKGIVEMHGGRIWVESQQGAGCKFYMLLPVLPYEGAVRELIRREIAFCGTGRKEFCAVTLQLPAGADGELAAKAENFLRAGMRSAHALLKGENGDFTLLLSNAGPREGCRASSFLEKGVAELFGTAPGEGGEATFILSYPGDFTDEEGYMRKFAEARGRQAA